MPAIDAAIDRYKRHRPAGLVAHLTGRHLGAGLAAPRSLKLVEESATELLPMLHEVPALPPS